MQNVDHLAWISAVPCYCAELQRVIENILRSACVSCSLTMLVSVAHSVALLHGKDSVVAIMLDTHFAVCHQKIYSGMVSTSHGEVGGTVAALVAQRPGDDARVVLVALAHAHAPVHDGIQPAQAHADVSNPARRTTEHVQQRRGLSTQLRGPDYRRTSCFVMRQLFMLSDLLSLQHPL